MSDLRSATGGWNELIEQLVNQLGDTALAEAKTKIVEARNLILASKSLTEELGVLNDLKKFMRTLAAYAEVP